jgi:chromosome segregation ATPase
MEFKNLTDQIHNKTMQITEKDRERSQILLHYKKLVAQQEIKSETQTSLQKSLEKLRMEVLIRDKRITQLSATLEHLQRRYEASNRELETSKDTNSNLKQESDQHSKNTNETEYAKRINELTSEIEALSSRNKQLDQVIQQERTRFLKQVESLKEENKSLSQRVDYLETRSKDATEFERKLTRELENTRRELNQLNQFRNQGPTTPQGVGQDTTSMNISSREALLQEWQAQNVALQDAIDEDDSVVRRKHRMLENEKLLNTIMDSRQALQM